jgi:polyisoprenoid-binding protein YceI
MTTARQLTGVYELDRTHSSVDFEVTHMQVSTFRASFADVDARLTVQNGTSELEGRVVVESVSIGDPPEFREHVVRSSDFFDAGAHPEITFRSTSVDLHGDGTATVAGEITIRGVSWPVTARGTYNGPTADPFGATRAGLELETTVDRRAWSLDWQAPLPGGGDALGWDVRITARLELIRTG